MNPEAGPSVDLQADGGVQQRKYRDSVQGIINPGELESKKYSTHLEPTTRISTPNPLVPEGWRR